MKRFVVPLSIFVLAIVLAFTPAIASAKDIFLNKFNTVKVIASTVPANGDINPYGVVVVPRSVGSLVKGDILVSNFNNSSNAQGTGITIDQISPGGKFSLFATIDASSLPGACPGGVGLTTALGVVRRGWVIVGSLPTSDGQSATAQAGCLIILNSNGKAVETISGSPINGPWDMTLVDIDHQAILFVSNVLNGTVAASPNVVNEGTVARIVLSFDGGMPRVLSRTVIASGFAERTDPDALVIGPTGLAINRNGNLYVADTLDNRITVISHAITRTTSAGVGSVLTSGGSLNSPLGLIFAPGGELIAANAGDGNLVEISPRGVQDSVKLVNSGGGGTLFGLALVPGNKGIYLVDDGNNNLDLLTR